MGDVTVPTLIGQGQADTLFNLQESVATYTALKQQGTPVSLVWQSWGHSDSTPVAGELDLRHPARVLPGPAGAGLVRPLRARHRGRRPPQNFPYFRDWVFAATGDIDAGLRRRAVLPGRHGADLLPLGRQAARQRRRPGDEPAARSRAGSSSYASLAPIGPNYTETSALDQSRPVHRPAGDGDPLRRRRRWPQPGRRRRLPAAHRAAGRARRSRHAGRGPAGQLVVFAKLYDVGPDGDAVELPHRLISPVRSPTSTQPITIELPGIVHRFEAGHRLAVVLAGGDMAYRGLERPRSRSA